MDTIVKVKKSVANVIKRQKIASLKSKAKSLYITMHGRGDRLSCGHSLAMHVSGSYAEACIELDKVLDELALIDPETPTRRFSK